MHSTQTDHATTERPSAVEPSSEERTLGQYIPLLYHYNMLQDEDRVGAFREAIELVVQPGMHVLELGGGTGILSSFAARRGAKVTCIERNPELVRHAKRFVSSNRLASNIEVVAADAATYIPTRPVDVVVCEMLHVALLREKQAQVIAAFKRNYTTSVGGPLPMFLPEASILMAQPVQHDFNFAGYLAPVPLFQAPLLEQPRTLELADLWPYANVSYDQTIPLVFQARQPLTTQRAGTCNAIRFVTQNVITVDLQAQRAITWPNQCMVLPLETPFEAAAGMPIELAFDYQAGAAVESLAASLTAQPTSN